MAFKIGDVIIDRAQFGYGATKAGVPLYALTQLNNFNIDITADSTDVNDARGNLVYRKYAKSILIFPSGSLCPKAG